MIHEDNFLVGMQFVEKNKRKEGGLRLRTSLQHTMVLWNVLGHLVRCFVSKMDLNLSIIIRLLFELKSESYEKKKCP